MQYHKQLIKHSPKEGKYGDCMRTCIACLLNYHPRNVPNFGEYLDEIEMIMNLDKYLLSEGYQRFAYTYTHIDELHEFMQNIFPNVYYILCGKTEYGNSHMVICCNGAIIHDPSWLGLKIVKPHEGWFWGIILYPSMMIE